MESGALEADKRQLVRLYYGIRSPAHLAFKESIPDWEARRVEVVPVFSGEGATGAADIPVFSAPVLGGWRGGWVSFVEFHELCGRGASAQLLSHLLPHLGTPAD